MTTIIMKRNNPIARLLRRLPQKRVPNKKKNIKTGYEKHKGSRDDAIQN